MAVDYKVNDIMAVFVQIISSIYHVGFYTFVHIKFYPLWKFSASGETMLIMRWNSTIRYPNRHWFSWSRPRPCFTDGKPFYHPRFQREHPSWDRAGVKNQENGKTSFPDLETTIMMRLDWASILQRGTCKINSKKKDNPGNWPRPLIKCCFG